LIADVLESCLRAEGDILGLDGDDDCRPFLGFVAKFCRRAAGGDGFGVV
jgi:hypothetical protein